MEMTSLNISLPVEMKQFIENKTSSGGYSTVSEYIRELVRADQKQETDLKAGEEKVVAMLLEGVRQLERGETVEVSPEFWEQKKRRLVDRFSKKDRA
jgi:antitoxin ParD1/3/4